MHRRTVRFARKDLSNAILPGVKRLFRSTKIAQIRDQTVKKRFAEFFRNVLMVLKSMRIQPAAERRLRNDQQITRQIDDRR